MIYKSTKHYGHNIGLSAVFRLIGQLINCIVFLYGYSS